MYVCVCVCVCGILPCSRKLGYNRILLKFKRELILSDKQGHFHQVLHQAVNWAKLIIQTSW